MDIGTHKVVDQGDSTFLDSLVCGTAVFLQDNGRVGNWLETLSRGAVDGLSLHRLFLLVERIAEVKKRNEADSGEPLARFPTTRQTPLPDWAGVFYSLNLESLSELTFSLMLEGESKEMFWAITRPNG